MGNINKKITIKDDNGKEKEYSILATFRFSGKNIVLYTDYTRDEKRRIKVHGSIYNPDEDKNNVEKITSEKVSDFVNAYVKKLAEDLESKMKFMESLTDEDDEEEE